MLSSAFGGSPLTCCSFHNAGCVLPLLALATVLSGRRLSRVEISTPLLLALEVVVALAGSAVRCVCGVPYGVA